MFCNTVGAVQEFIENRFTYNKSIANKLNKIPTTMANVILTKLFFSIF